MSTCVQALIFLLCMTQPGTHALVLAHKDEACDYLNEMAQCFIRNLPKGKDQVTHTGKEKIVFRNGSSITYKTAGGYEVGRAGTFQIVHMSEVAFYESSVGQAARVANSAIQAVPTATPNTIIIRETTANGVGGYFYDCWQSAVRGKSAFMPYFLPWHADPNNTLTAPAGIRLSSEEVAITKQYDLSLDQIWWRRRAIADQFNGDANAFKQEFPSNPEEAFLLSGSPYFDRPDLEAYMPRIEAAKKRSVGDIVLPPAHADLEWKYNETDSGGLTIYEYPQRGVHYVIGGDVAEGLPDGDYSVLEVLDLRTLVQVAEYRTRRDDPEEFGLVAYLLGLYYNFAWIGMEVNNHGYTTNLKLLNLRYPHLHCQTEIDHRFQRAPSDRPGWRTEKDSRRHMLDTLKAKLREGRIGLNSRDTWHECWVFSRTGKAGKPQAPSGDHDDCVMALAIAVQMSDLHPPPRIPEPKPVDDLSGAIAKHLEAKKWRNRRQRWSQREPNRFTVRT